MMNPETKQCQNCKNNFTIEPDDFEFYKKIDVPAPTFCPGCRLQRRLAFFNIFNLYKRPCAFCKKDFISAYYPEAPYIVYCPKCWWSDEWDTFSYGIEYDFSRPFFEQFKEHWQKTPVLGISIDIPAMETSPYTSHAGHLKNCYLLFHADYVEDSAYGFYLDHCKSVFNCGTIFSSEHCYDCQHSFKNNRCVGTRGNVTNSLDCWFLRDCDNCQNCFASANLRSKKYHIFNKPYSKEEYFKEIEKWDLGSYTTYEKVKKMAFEHWRLFLPRPVYDNFSVDCTGNYVFQSKNCKECFSVSNVHDSKFMLLVSGRATKDCYDISSWGNNMSRCYECCNVGEDVFDVRFNQESGLGTMNADYCKLSTGRDFFGCISIKKGEYCIFNKQYSKEEYKTLRGKIVKHMDDMPYVDKKGRVYKFGEFFPIGISPFGYNETIANSFSPLTRQEIEEKGYRFWEPEEKQYSISLSWESLPDHIKDAKDSILSETIACSKCKKGYKIIQMELDFLRNMRLPLPRMCPFCRVNETFNQWVKDSHSVIRTCDKCGTVFSTNHTKEDAPKIFCKQCYQSEVI